MPARRYPLLAPWLRRYFYSGWAFLMPYLFAYLLYYVTKWPVNAAAGAAEGVRSQESGVSILSPIATHPSPIPCLLHLYWALHAINAILAGVALWSWIKEHKSQTPDSKLQNQSTSQAPAPELLRSPAPTASDPLATNYQLPTTSASSPLLATLLTLAPWLLLALLFYIPGVYLEWPSDPWEHLRRINEWRILETVGAHSSWLKSSYFIPYSFLSWCIGLRQLFWLDYYYTGICLLLCWQYYRFSRACGLGERASMVFVIIQALLFGNNIFSFYRYYGISSSIYAQLGAIALTRIILEFAARGTRLEPREFPVGPQLACAPLSVPGTDASSDPTQCLSPIARHPSPITDTPSALRRICTLLATHYSLLISVPALITLTALNHPQGLGVAALGITSVLIWRLIEWKRFTLWWLIAATIVINALFLWLYHRPAIIESYRAQGYLNAWYGFNILDLTSPAGDRMLQILSVFGLVDLAAALFLFHRNYVIAWISITPLIILLSPSFAVPFAQLASLAGGEFNVVTFQRILLAIPFGSALIYYGTSRDKLLSARILTVGIVPASLAVAIATPPNGDQYNRTWHTLSMVSADLRMQQIINVVRPLYFPTRTQPKPIATYSTGFIMKALGIQNIEYSYRIIGGLPACNNIGPQITTYSPELRSKALLYIPSVFQLTSFRSFASQLSSHWPPQNAAVDLAGGRELTAEAIAVHATFLPSSNGILFSFPRPPPTKQ